MSNYSYSQVWQGTNGSSHKRNGGAYSLCSDNDGNVYVTGYTTIVGNSSSFCTIKYNPNGVQQWVAIYHGQAGGEDKAYAITIDKDANIYVTGYTTNVGSRHDFTTIKYNTNGVQQWVAIYNPGNENAEAYAIIIDEKNEGSGNNKNSVFVTGMVNVNNTMKMYTAKFDGVGNFVWGNYYNSYGEGNAYSIVMDHKHNVYVTGYSTSASGASDFTTIKYNSSGTQNWVAIYNGTGNSDDKAYAITIDKDYLYITGYSTNIQRLTDFATIKYNYDGNQLWVARYSRGTEGNNQAQAIDIDKIGNIYVTGWSNQSSTGNADYATIKYNQDGVQQWVEYYNGPANSDDMANSISIGKDGSVLVTGGSKEKSIFGLFYHFATIKYDSSGNQLWISRYTARKLEDIASEIILDKVGNSYVTGRSLIDGTNFDYSTIKYNSNGTPLWVGTFSGLNENNNILNTNNIKEKYSQKNINIPNSYFLYQNYPNPFNPSTKIKFDLKNSSQVNLVVYNMIGEKITTLVDNYLKSGSYEVNFKPEKLSSGIYYYELTADNYRDIKKMILIK